MIRATLDTNVLVSGLAGLEVPTSTPGAIVRHWLNGAFELVTSAGIPAERERTLTKPYYRLRRSPSQIAAVVSLVASEATIVVPTVIISGVTTHPEDDLVLAVAVSAHVDYLVTGTSRCIDLVPISTFTSSRLARSSIYWSSPGTNHDRLRKGSSEAHFTFLTRSLDHSINQRLVEGSQSPTMRNRPL